MASERREHGTLSERVLVALARQPLECECVRERLRVPPRGLSNALNKLARRGLVRKLPDGRWERLAS